MIALAMKKGFSFVIAEQWKMFISHPSVCKYFNRDLIHDSTLYACRNAGNQQTEMGILTYQATPH